MKSHTEFRAHGVPRKNTRASLPSLTVLIAVFAVLALSGCTGVTGAGAPSGNSKSAASVSAGTLAPNTASISFGNVAVGASTSQMLMLTNTGSAAVNISQANITGAGFSVVGGMSSISIPAGQSQGFQVQFAPKSTGAAIGSLAVASDASNSPMAISLSGNGMSDIAISAQPANQSVVAGQTASFSVMASGAGTLSYQWSKNGAAISGATSASYTTPATVSADNGAQFSVTIADSTGSTVSNSAALTVTAAAVAPSITTQPVSQTVTAGQTATFSTTATGTATLAYQWKKNGAAIAGATSASYTSPATTAADTGAQFTVTVSNNTGNVTSNAAILTVNVPPAITAQPANQTVSAGQSATFTVVASGSGTLTYQWSKNGAAISGATSSSYTTPVTTASDNGAQFTVAVTGSGGTVTSGAAILTVNTPPTISAQPVNQSVTVGQTAGFSVAASGSGTLSYQWKKNGTAIGGATSASYTTPATVAGDNGATFTVTVSNSAGSVTTNAATLTVTSAPVAPSITAQPASQAVTAGQTASFSVTATGTATLSYQWKKNGAAIAGGTSASYTTPATAASDNGALFTVTVTNTTGNVTSNAATLTVNVPPSITTQPVSKTVTAGTAATFSVTAAGSGSLAYQWSKNGAAVSGATSASYTTPAAVASDNGALFTVTVTNTVGAVTSSAATLNVNVPPSITTQPASKTVSAGQTATFSVAATGTATLTYQWSKNGAAVTGATSASYTTPAATASDNGALFTVTVTNAYGSVTSGSATLTVSSPPSITTQPASQSVTAGQTATFSVVATGTGTLTYQWLKNGTNVTGATSASYTTPATSGADNGSKFSVTVTNATGSTTSSAATLTVSVPPTFTLQPASQSVIAGQTATFTAAASGTPTLTYQWTKNGTAIGGATSASYTTPAASTSDNGAQFAVNVTNGAGSVTSNVATLTVNAATLVLNANQTSLAFASVNLGSSSVLAVVFTNAGNSSVTISNVSISGPGFTAAGVSSGQILTPGQSATLNVTFAPSSAAAANGSVIVTSNATNSPKTLTLSGTGVQPVTHSVTLNWTASVGASGYNVYRSSVTGGPYTKLNASPIATTSYTDSAVQAGQTYYYVLTSVNSSGVESAFSTEVSAVVP